MVLEVRERVEDGEELTFYVSSQSRRTKLSDLCQGTNAINKCCDHFLVLHWDLVSLHKSGLSNLSCDRTLPSLRRGSHSAHDCPLCALRDSSRVEDSCGSRARFPMRRLDVPRSFMVKSEQMIMLWEQPSQVGRILSHLPSALRCSGDESLECFLASIGHCVTDGFLDTKYNFINTMITSWVVTATCWTRYCCFLQCTGEALSTFMGWESGWST